MNRSFYLKFLLALFLGLALLYLLDCLDVTPISYPVCLSIVLMGISLRQKPSLVVAVSVVYAVLVTYSEFYFLLHSNPFHVPFSYRLFALVQREGVFIVVCAMAINISFYRIASEQTLSDLEKTLDKIPIPVVISNEADVITYANECLRVTFKHLPADLIGQKYTDYFLPGMEQGRKMLFYLQLFGDDLSSFTEIDIVPFGETVPMLARVICHTNGLKRNLITVLQPADSTLRPVFV
jgi:hypothetical protein